MFVLDFDFLCFDLGLGTGMFGFALVSVFGLIGD